MVSGGQITLANLRSRYQSTVCAPVPSSYQLPSNPVFDAKLNAACAHAGAPPFGGPPVIAQRGGAGLARLKADRQSAADRLAALVGERFEGLAHESGVDVIGLRQSATQLLIRISGLDARLAAESRGGAASADRLQGTN